MRDLDYSGSSIKHCFVLFCFQRNIIFLAVIQTASSYQPELNSSAYDHKQCLAFVIRMSCSSAQYSKTMSSNQYKQDSFILHPSKHVLNNIYVSAMGKGVLLESFSKQWSIVIPSSYPTNEYWHALEKQLTRVSPT